MRLFIAVDPGQAALTRMGETLAALRARHPGPKWANPEQSHLTLAFLGNVPEDRIDAVKRTMEESVRGVQPFSCCPGGAGAFHSWRNPRVVWLGLSAGGEELSRIEAGLRAVLKRGSFDVEDREFHPHLTLCRLEGKPQGLETLRADVEKECAEARWRDCASTVQDIRLMESRLTPNGAIHTVLHRQPLGTA